MEFTFADRPCRMGQGFSMAAEDAAVMTHLLDAVESRQDLVSAFQAFDKVRRGPQSRPGWVVKHGRTLALLCGGQRGLDPSSALQGLESIPELFAYLWEGDIKKEIENALNLFREIKANGC